MDDMVDSNKKLWIERLLTSPVGDKLAALVLVAWLTNSSFIAIQQDHGLPLTMLFAAVIVLNIQILVRRTPERITLNPWFWLLTVSASGHVALYGLLVGEEVQPITPHWFNNGLAIIGMAMMIWARLCMGRKFGFVPAMRGIVSNGPFRVVRHPIYTSIILLLIARFLDAASLVSAILCLIGIGLWVLKCLVEESFLRPEPEYQAYTQKVRWRLLPGIF